MQQMLWLSSEEVAMTLTVLDPRTGEKVTMWFPDAVPAAGPKGEVIPLRPAAPARAAAVR